MGRVICGQEAIDHVATHGGVLRRGEYEGGRDACGDVIGADTARALVAHVGELAVYCEEGEDDEAAFLLAVDSMEREATLAHKPWLAELTAMVGSYLRAPSDEALATIRAEARGKGAIEDGVSSLRNALSSYTHTRHNGFLLSRHRAAARIEQVVGVIFPPDTYPAFGSQRADR